MTYSLYMARRLSLSPSGRGKTPAVRVATVAVALSVAVMMLALAVVQGFRHEITARVSGFNSHLSVYAQRVSPDDDNIVTLTPALEEALDSLPGLASYGLQAVAPAVFKTPGDFKGIYLKSLDEPMSRRFIAGSIVSGSMPDWSDPAQSLRIVISRTAADQLGLNPGDKVDTYFITDDVRVRRLEVAGVFDTHFSQYDDVLAYSSLDLVRDIGGLSDRQGTSLQVALGDIGDVGPAAAALQSSLHRAYMQGTLAKPMRVVSVEEQGTGYFRWLDLLDTNTVVIIILMTVVASVTLVSGMLIIILDRKRFIGLMKALGTPDRTLRSIFVWLALRVALRGIVAGTLVAGVLVAVQWLTHAVPLDPDSYYMDYVPVRIGWAEVLLLDGAALAVAFAALLLPSSLVARISPAETLAAE